MLGFIGDTKIAQYILDGTEDIWQITDDKAAKLLLESMKLDTDPIIFYFTPQDTINWY